MAFTDNYALQFIRLLSGLSNTAPLNQAYIGLSTTTPSTDGTNFTEPSASAGYSRAFICTYNAGAGWNNKMTTTASGGVGTSTSNDIIFFPEATASWGTVTHFGLFASATATTPVIFGELTNPVTIQANYVPLFRTGQLIITIS